MAAALVAVVGLMIYLKHHADRLREQEPFLERPKTFVTDYVKSETVHDEALGSVKKVLLKGLRERDWSKAASGLAERFRGKFPAVSDGKEVPDAAMRIRRFERDGLKELGADAFLKTVETHVGAWTSVDRSVLRCFEFLLDPGEKRAFAAAHFQLAGRTKGEGRAEIAGSVEMLLVKTGEKEWKVRQMGWADGWTIESERPPFRDVTDATGLHFNESANLRGLLQEIIDNRGLTTLGGLAVADFNRDGFWDVLASIANNETALFLNDGRGGFTRGETPVADPKESGYVWMYVDLDNDGLEELVGSEIRSYEGLTACASLWTRRGGRWEPLPSALRFPIRPGERDLLVQAIVPHDLDGNGLLDLWFGIYTNRNSKGQNFNRVHATDGADNQLFMNLGGLRFSEESDRRGMTGTQYTLVGKWWDFDFDGDTDFFEGNDYGKNHLWLNDGKGHFTDARDHLFNQVSCYTMGVTISDWDNTGDWSMYISNMYSHAGNRIVPLVADLSPAMKEAAKILAQGNFLYDYNTQARQWTESGVAANVNWADWAWSCLFFDPDNDTDKDIFVANGFTSHQDASAPDY
jgi:hypothetical protein